MNLIAELKEERLARRRAKSIEEKQRKIKRIKRRRRGVVISVILIIAGLGIISGVVAYINYAGTAFNETGAELLATELPSETAAPAVIIVGEDGVTKPPVVTTEIPIPAAGGAYTEFNLAGRAFAYPSEFKLSDDSSALLRAEDGAAVITAGKTVTGSAPKDLMKKYSNETGGTSLKSIADDSGYDITIRVGADICHKKSVVESGTEVWYEIRYPEKSEKSAQYEIYIKYMDSFF